MKTFKGILGFLLLVLGGAFINAPIIALLAILILIGGAFLVTVFYLGEFDKNTAKLKMYKLLIIMGVILSVFLLAMCVIEYTGYLVELDRSSSSGMESANDGHPVRFPLTPVLSDGALNVIFALGISYLLKKGAGLSWEASLFRGLPIAFLIPATLMLVKILVNNRFPMLG